MSFSKAKTKRFNEQVIGCGPPPTAYDPKLPGHGHAVSFTKGERFRHQNLGHDLPDAASQFQLTRSHSSSSVGSSESGHSSKTEQANKKDHARCNKKIDELEKELRSITKERNELLKQRNHTSSITCRCENKENEQVPHICPDVEKLNQTICELQVKLENAKAIEQDKRKLEDERDNALADLESKKVEISAINQQIESIKVLYNDQENKLKLELEKALEMAANQKMNLESQIASLETNLEAKDSEKIAAENELKAQIEEREKRLIDMEEKHRTELDRLEVEYKEKYQQLENNLQQLAAEHEAESEQLRFEFGRQIEELNASHAAAVQKLNKEHAAELENVRTSFQEQLQELDRIRDQLTAEKDDLNNRNAEINSLLDCKVAEITQMKEDFEAEKIKLASDYQNLQEKSEAAKQVLENEIGNLKASLVEQQAALQADLMVQFEQEKSALNESINELAAQLHAKQMELQSVNQKLADSSRNYEEQLSRLAENTQTEKEILIWQMNQEKSAQEQALKADYERCLNDKDRQFENMKADLETKLNQAKEEYENQVEMLMQEHETRLESNRKSHAELVLDLERQKWAVTEERDAVMRQLAEKEVEIDELTNQMNKTTAQLQLDLELLRESNDGLVSDVMRVTQEKLISEERLETEKIEIVARLDEEKKALVSSYEESLTALKAVLDDRDKQVSELGEKMCSIEVSARQFMDEKLVELEDMRSAHVSEMERLSTAHKEEVLNLHKRYECVILSMEQKFVDDTEQLAAAHLNVLETLKIEGQDEMKVLQDEFRVTLVDLERQFAEERDQMAKTHDQELLDLNEIHEEKLKLVRQEHDIIASELRRNFEESMENLKDLQTEIEDLRVEHRNLLAATHEKELQHLADIESWNDSLNGKEEELIKLRQQIEQRERQMADDWIQRETELMDQFSARFHDAKCDYETRLQNAEEDKRKVADKLNQVQKERDEAVAELEVFQIKMDTQMTAIEEQHEEERSMLQARWTQQMQEITSINAQRLAQLEVQLVQTGDLTRQLHEENEELRSRLEATGQEFDQKMEALAREHRENVQVTIRRVVEPMESELDDLRKEHEDYLALQKKYEELLALIEPFREQLEMFEAEKNALYNQALSAEHSMASITSKYTQLLGHQNNKQKIHHLDKLKQDIFSLRKDLSESRLALEKEKKARQKAEAKLKELTGQRKYDPSEAFKVPETPAPAPAPAAVPAAANRSSRQSAAGRPAKSETSKERVPLRAQPKGAFFVSMAEIEATQAEMEQEKQRQIQARREKSEQFEAFVVEFGNSRRETFDVPPKLNVTRNISEDKENVRGGFVHDLSGISMADEVAQKSSKSNLLRPDVLTSTPLSVQRHGPK